MKYVKYILNKIAMWLNKTPKDPHHEGGNGFGGW